MKSLVAVAPCRSGESPHLHAVGRDLLLDKASLAGQQLAEGGLTTADLDELAALAARVKTSGASAGGARTQGPVSQASLDLQDGICLEYLERMMKIWNGAHERDPSIPQLLPIATRALFSPTRKPAATKGAETPTVDVVTDPAIGNGNKPKAQSCLHDKFNHDLAGQSFPARAVDDVGKSFHESVERLRASSALVAALAATRASF